MDMLERFAGIDWGSRAHQACVVDDEGEVLAERAFDHGGAGLAEMAAWILAAADAEPRAVGIAIEVPHGPVVETLMERGFAVHAVNPKQLDRFRDRFSPAGAKDDRRDARVLADALRTDGQAFRRLDPEAPEIVQLRAWSRIASGLTRDRIRYVNQARQQFWRYYPKFCEVGSDLSRAWVRELWRLAPTPAKARRVRASTVAALLKRHRVRRIDAETVLRILREPAISVAPGTTEAAIAHVEVAFSQLAVVEQQLAKAHRELARLTAALSLPAASAEEEPGTGPQRDAEIPVSLPGVGRIVLATLLAEAHDPLRRRDYHALRCLSGVAPVTRRSRCSSPAASRPTTGSGTPSTTGPRRQCSGIPSARRNTLRCGPGATATRARCEASPTACSASPARCWKTGPSSIRTSGAGPVQPDPRTTAAQPANRAYPRAFQTLSKWWGSASGDAPGGHAGAVSNVATLRFSGSNSTPTRCTVRPGALYLSA